MRNPFRKQAYDSNEPVLNIKRMLIENGAIEAELNSEPEAIANMYAMLGLLLGNAPNYVEASIEVKPKPKAPHEAFVVTVQRRSGKTPHELRTEAEKEAEKAKHAMKSMMDLADSQNSLNESLLDDLQRADERYRNTVEFILLKKENGLDWDDNDSATIKRTIRSLCKNFPAERDEAFIELELE